LGWREIYRKKKEREGEKSIVIGRKKRSEEMVKIFAAGGGLWYRRLGVLGCLLRGEGVRGTGDRR